MLTNAYDSTVGSPFKTTDKIDATIKALHIARSLSPTKKENVFVITYDNQLTIPVFVFPITLQAYNNKLITVYDERPYRNKNTNQVVNPNELTIQKLTAFLQQDVTEGNVSPLKKCRLVATKGFSEAISNKLVITAGLNSNEALTLKTLLAYYFISLQEPLQSDLELVAINVIREVYGTDKGYVLGVIQDAQDLGKMTNITQLLTAITRNPILYKLKGLTLKDFIHVISSITFSSFGSKSVGAACETPCLFTAMVYAAVKYGAYSKTHLGKALDPKYNKNLLGNFTLNVEFIYDLG